MLYRPAAVLEAVFRIRLLVPVPITVGGLKLTLAPAGKPDALKLSGVLNPPTAVTLTGIASEPPTLTFCASDGKASEKSGVPLVLVTDT